jgi:hypothetical protein
MMAALWLPGAALAQKLNAAYVNDQPEPFGGVTAATAATYGATRFNRFNVMGLHYRSDPGCDGGSGNGCANANPIHFSETPALTAAWGVPASATGAVQIIAALKASGATVYATILGDHTTDYLAGLDTAPMVADAQVCGPGGSGIGNVNCAVFYLDKFLSAYGFDGLDIDLETFDATGFETLLTGIGQSPAFRSSYGLSFAPYADDGPASISVLDGACVFKKNGITDYFNARQYYAGGILWSGTVPDAVDAILEKGKTFPCPDGQPLGLTPSQYGVGMSPYSVLGDQFPAVRGGPNNCQYYYQRGYPDCAAEMAQIVKTNPDIAGTFVWTLGLLDPAYYACTMDNALNGTTADCGTPQPVAGDEGNACQPLADGSTLCCGPTETYSCTGGGCTCTP